MQQQFAKRPDYFIAAGITYKFLKYERDYCSLHGEFIGYKVSGLRIKASGYVGSTRCVCSLDSLDANSRDCIKRYIDSHEAINT